MVIHCHKETDEDDNVIERVSHCQRLFLRFLVAVEFSIFRGKLCSHEARLM